MKVLKQIGSLALGISLVMPTQAKVTVNEVMPCNISTYMDMEFYDFPGWVELHNSGDEVSLKGYTISHCKLKKGGKLEFKNKWVIEEDLRLDSGAYKLLFFDNIDEFTQSEKDNNPDGYKINLEKAKKYIPFKLDSDGGSITLYKEGTKIDSFVYSPLESHISFGRDNDKTGYMNPTPGKKNGGAYSDRIAKMEFDGVTPGVVEGEIKVRFKCETEGVEIYYTDDGSEPTKKSESYSGEFIIADGDTKVIRARAFLGDKPASEILTGTFLYLDYKHKNCGGFTVPIVSISTDIDYFEDPEIGMAVVGENGVKTDLNCLNDVQIFKANFLQDWRRPVVFEYIEDGSSVMAHEMEAGIIGGCSRKNSIQSLKFKAGSKVGSSKKYLEINPFKDRPGNKYSSLHLRNGGNAYEAGQVRVRDGYMQALSKPMNLDYQAYQPVAYYLNGKYKGLMGLRERTNKDYVEANYGLEEDEIDHMELVNSHGVEATTGTLDWYNKLVEYIENNDPKSESYYETACKYMDMDEYIDFQLFEHFIVNTDWPGNNAKIWRDRKNGKLRWIIFDTDFGLGIYDAGWPNYCSSQIDFIDWASGTGDNVNWANGSELSGQKYEFNEDSKWKVTIFAHLIQNPEFQERFINKTLIHLGTTFTNERVQAVWDSLKNVVEDEYCAFAGNNTNLDDMGGVSKMLNFAKERPQYMYNHTAKHFKLGDYVNLKYSSDVEGTKFLMNDEFVNFSSYDGRYIAGRPLTLEAIAPAGYKFSHWEIKDNSSYVNLMGDTTTWKYFYQSESPESAWKTIDFDDSEWKDGIGKMGYSIENDESKSNLGYNTILDFGDNSNEKYMRAYFRKTFNIEDKSKYNELIAKIVYDDGYIFYLNGKEISRQKVATDLKEGEEYANPDSEDAVEEVSISMDDLVEGENILAIMVCQNSSSSSDFTFKFSMNAANKGDEGVIKDYRKIYSTNLSGDFKIKAVIEKYDCTDMVNDYSVLVLNEVAPSNDSSTDIIDEYGIHSDWFEIYNSGEDTINLAGLYLSDDLSNLGKNFIPYTDSDSTKIEPKGFVRFWADNATYRGVLHADFKLSNTDPTGLYLSVKCGDEFEVISELGYKQLSQNASFGYLQENRDVLIEFNAEFFKYSCENKDECQQGYKCPSPGRSNILCPVECTQLEDAIVLSEGDVQIYPNPTESYLNIKSESVKIVSVRIFDNMGRMLLYQETEGTDVVLDLGQYSVGTYYLQIVTEQEVIQRKILKL